MTVDVADVAAAGFSLATAGLAMFSAWKFWQYAKENEVVDGVRGLKSLKVAAISLAAVGFFQLGLAAVSVLL